MHVDKKIMEIATQVQAEFKAKFGKDISVQRIIDMADLQAPLGIIKAMETGDTFKQDFLGKWTIRENDEKRYSEEIKNIRQTVATVGN